MRKICYVTGTRAEYGLLSRLMRLVKDDLLSTNRLQDDLVVFDVKATPQDNRQKGVKSYGNLVLKFLDIII